MQDEKRFMELLYGIVDMARSNGNSITTKEVDEFFEELSLDEKQKDAVYNYLCKGHIKVIGYTVVPEDTASENGEQTNKDQTNKNPEYGFESHRTKHYRKAVREMQGADLKKLYERVVAGGNDDETSESLINAYLPVVINFSSRYSGRGAAGDELIQEGNLALILAVNNIMSGLGCLALDSFNSFDSYIRGSIRKGITDYIDSEIEREGELQVLLGKAQLVKDAAVYLSKELGRAASVYELSEYTHIPEDEINDIIKFSGDAQIN